MAKIYVAQNNAGIVPNAHLYLLFDQDENLSTTFDQQILRGGPSETPSLSNNFSYGVVVVQPNFPEGLSLDSLGADDPQDRDFTVIDIPSNADAYIVWDDIQSYVSSLGYLEVNQNSEFRNHIITEFDYERSGINSNSIISSALSAVGIDLGVNSPAGLPLIGFLGSNIYLSGSGNDILQGFGGNDRFYDLGGGNDEFYGGTIDNRVVSDVSDGRDTVVYERGGFAGLGLRIRTVGDHREVDDMEGGIDVLYSIEQVNMRTFFLGNTVDYSDHDQGIKLKDNSPQELQKLNEEFEDILSSSVIKEGENDKNLFTVNNFGTFIGTVYDDVFDLGDVLGREFYGGSGQEYLGDALSYVLLQNQNGVKIDADLGTVVIRGSDEVAGPGGVINDSFTGMEIIGGSHYGDEIAGSSGTDKLFGHSGDDIIIGGAGNDEIHGGSGIDTLDYSQDAAYGGTQRVVVNEFVAREGTVIDGFGNTDTFYGIENFTLTGGNDQIYLKVPLGQRTVDGGDGTDSLTYDYGRYDQTTGVYSDISGTYTDTLNSVENINMLGGTVVLDMTQDYLFTPQYQYSYAKATQGLDITITNSGHFTASGSGTSATANFSQSVYVEVNTGAATHSGIVSSISAAGSFSSVVQTANSHVWNYTSSGGVVSGTGLGDNVVINSNFSSNTWFVGSSLSFMSGVGNDDITNYSGVNLVYRYSGGLDTIKGRVAQITFAASILPDDVNVARNDDGFSITINGHGSIQITEWNSSGLGLRYESLAGRVYSAYPDAEGEPVQLRPSQASGSYNISGLESDDTLIGTELTDDTIYGYEGNDTLIGGGGDDHLYGGAGDDTYVFAAGDGYDTIYDLDGQNILKIEGVAPENIVYVRVGNDLRLEIGSGVIIKDYYTFGSQTISLMEFDGGVMVDPAIGAATALIAGEGDIFGNNGDNTLTGTDGDDVIYGFGGNDLLDGGYGQNTLYGGLGNDTYRFSNPDSYAVISDEGGFLDTVLMPVTVRDLSFFGWDGEDYLINFSNIEEFLSVRLLNQGESTPDARIENLTFVDGFTLNIQDLESAVFRSDLGGTYNGSSARDVTIGSHSNDILYGNNGDDLLYGGYGHDTIYGGDGSDTLYGSDGHDVLYGGAGFDFILGGDGNDILDGGTGFDWLNGGLGDDTYILRPDGDIDYLQDDGGDNDKIILDTSISFADLVFAQDGNSLTVSAFGGTMIVLDHFFEGSHTVIEWLDYGGAELFDLRTLYTEPQNTPPQAKNDTFTALEGQTVTGNVLANNGAGADSDADGDPLSVVPAEFMTPAGASVLLLSNGDFIYTPLENYNGADSFTYTLQDGQGGSQTGIVSFGILPVNDMPEAFDDHFTVNEDEVLIGNVLLDNGNGADTDIDGDILRVEAGSYTTAAGGFVVMDESGTFTYTPAADYHGTDTFTYMLGDGAGGVSMATATIDVLSVNDGPEAFDDRFTGQENNEIEGNLLADNGFGADFDLEGDNLRVVQDMVTSAAGGSVILMHNGDFVYMPPAGYSGEDSFVYTITDGNGGQASATAFITLEPSNEAPVVQDDNASGFILETIGGNVLLDNGFGADADPDGDPLGVEPAGFMTAKGGLVMIQANGDYTYTAVAGFTGTDSFTYTVTDGQGGVATATVNLSIGLKGNEIVGSNGSNLLIGSNHTDTILGQGGADFILGRQATDKILGGSGKDFIHGQNGDDLLIGGSDSDALYGGNGHDTLIGDDILMTASGSYYHAGSGGDADLLYGGNGNDLLIGGAGNDCLYGGNGADTFMFLQGPNGTDRIGDFSVREGDRIDIADILQGAYDPLADMINQFVKIERQGRDAKLSIDADGADNGSHFTALAIIEGGKDLTLETLLQNGGLVV